MKTMLEYLEGRVHKQGEMRKEGGYLVFTYLDFKRADGNIERVEDVAMCVAMANSLSAGSRFKFLDGKKLNSVYRFKFLCGMQTKNGDVITDERLLRYTCKTRYFLACLSLIPPFTLIAPLVFRSANRLREARDNVGVFQPLEHKFFYVYKKKNPR